MPHTRLPNPPLQLADLERTLVGLSESRPIAGDGCEGSRFYDGAKNAIDRVSGIALLVISSPIIVACWILVKLTTSGPGFYSQARVGHRGKQFRIRKIRTMYHKVEELQGGAKWSWKGDPRVTSVGSILRKLHIDELPQLINVIRGEMSLVGPRPERPEFVAPLSDELLGYTDRLAVRPGVTGLAQIQLPADSDMQSVARKLSADLEYIRLRGFWLDFRLLFGTAIYLTGASYAIVRKMAMLPACEQPTDIPSSIREIEPIARRIDHL